VPVQTTRIDRSYVLGRIGDGGGRESGLRQGSTAHQPTRLRAKTRMSRNEAIEAPSG